MLWLLVVLEWKELCMTLVCQLSWRERSSCFLHCLIKLFCQNCFQNFEKQHVTLQSCGPLSDAHMHTNGKCFPFQEVLQPSSYKIRLSWGVRIFLAPHTSTIKHDTSGFFSLQVNWLSWTDCVQDAALPCTQALCSDWFLSDVCHIP